MCNGILTILLWRWSWYMNIVWQSLSRRLMQVWFLMIELHSFIVYYLSQTKLREGYVFTPICDSVQLSLFMEGLCPGGLCPKVSVRGLCPEGSLGGLCLCPLPCTVKSGAVRILLECFLVVVGRYACYWNALLLECIPVDASVNTDTNVFLQ